MMVDRLQLARLLNPTADLATRPGQIEPNRTSFNLKGDVEGGGVEEWPGVLRPKGPAPSLALNKAYVGQRAGRGIADALGGIFDMTNQYIANPLLSDIDYFTGGGLSGGTYDAPQVPMASDAIANAATELSGERIIDPAEVSRAAQLIGGGAELGLGLFADPSNVVAPGLNKLRKMESLLPGKKAADVVRDIEPGRVFDPQEFYDAVTRAKIQSRFGAAVERKPVEDYVDTKMFLSPDTKSGFAIKPDGDLVSLFSTERGRLASIMNTANRYGAKKLDAFDLAEQPLPRMYKKYGGYEETGRSPWNPDYAPPDWEPWMGEPPVTFMDRPDAIRRADRTYHGEPEGTRLRPSLSPTKQASFLGLPAALLGARYLGDDKERL